jgi:alcohol dehydrogenase YqhD (iron-dependent ADH family)
MQPFVYEALPTRVVFGSGTVRQVKDEVERLGARRALVLSTPGRGERLANEVASALGELSAGIHAGAVMHTPVDATEKALALTRERAADALVAVGGGSTTGLGKAIALRTDLPQIVLPTTYAGSEMTPILGETSGGVKTTQRSLKVLPEVVIYDVDLTVGLPRAVSATSGINAIAHAVEALYTKTATRSPRCWLRKPSRRWPVRCLGSRSTPRTRWPALTRSTGRGCAVHVSELSEWRYTTSSATCLAACSTCPTRRPIRPSCPTLWPTPLLPRRTQ